MLYARVGGGTLRRALCGLWISIALISACGSPAESPSSDPPSIVSPTPIAHDETRATEPPPVAAPDLPAEPARAPTADHEPDAPVTPPSADDIQRMRTALATARRLAHDSDWSASLTAYREALAAAPSGRVRCEAGFIALRAGADDLAEEWIKQALLELPPPELVDPDLRVPLAMCQYNAGLVLETRRRLGEAIEAFDRSLALRPNATVDAARARVALALASAPAAPVDTGPEVCRPVGIDDCLDSCTRGGVLHEVLVRASASDSASCAVYEPTPAAPELGAPAYEARIVVEAPERDGRVPLTLRLEGAPGRAGTFLVDLGTSYPTPGNESEAIVHEMSWVDAHAGGPPELLIRFGVRGEYELTHFDDTAGWCRSQSHSEGEHAMLCAIFDRRTGTELTCGRISLERDWRAMHDCASDPAALPREPTLFATERFVVALDASGGRVDLRLVEPVHGEGQPPRRETTIRQVDTMLSDARVGVERLLSNGRRPLQRPGSFVRSRDWF